MKQADQSGAARVIILGEEFSRGQMLVIKDMKSGQQEQVGWNAFLGSLSKA